MSGVFSVDAMIQTTKAKDAYWVLAVPEASVQYLPVCQILENQLITPKQSKVVCHTTYHTTSEL